MFAKNVVFAIFARLWGKSVSIISWNDL